MASSFVTQSTNLLRSLVFWAVVAALLMGAILLSTIYTGNYYLNYISLRVAFKQHPEFRLLMRLEDLSAWLVPPALLASVLLSLMQRRWSVWQIVPLALLVLVLLISHSVSDGPAEVIQLLHNALWKLL
ncbi:hypothetical protein EHF33_19885 (plasmid) [Deinococcus psychrotolerans]|uniref:Uncharacterized protein n=1 Tax=Deinococcus psychrotolerans TaxID=2489213 RepID=A0A3G8YJW3_9DEIO|nr:hypothetical protein [Deinococcus psychrotolerans]AZI45175.1 hypothetical protein EHF33_19885 [Deinococcus psychrotolerans]